MRWKQWRLIKAEGKWRLFDLLNDPQERDDVSGSHPDVVKQMRTQYDVFVTSLPPFKLSKDYSGGGLVPKGWGWEIGTGGNLP